MLSRRQREQLLTQLGGSRRPSPLRIILTSVNWEIVAIFVILMGFFGYTLWQPQPQFVVVGTLGLLLVGWVFSLCLHEFAHAATAVLGGDTSESTIYYLSFNPLRYLHPVTSILLPVLFLLLGGIGLPGGAVYLRRDLVRTRGWQSAISLAGPLMNLLVGLALAIPIRLGVFDTHGDLNAAVSALVLLQVFVVIINLLPIPPLDGYGVISPWLPRSVQAFAANIGMYSIFLVFLVLTVPPFAVIFQVAISFVLLALGVDPFSAYTGLATFQFWRQ